MAGSSIKPSELATLLMQCDEDWRERIRDYIESQSFTYKQASSLVDFLKRFEYELKDDFDQYDLDELEIENEDLHAQIDDLEDSNWDLSQENSNLQDQIDDLESKNADLQEKLNQYE